MDHSLAARQALHNKFPYLGYNNICYLTIGFISCPVYILPGILPQSLFEVLPLFSPGSDVNCMCIGYIEFKEYICEC